MTVLHPARVFGVLIAGVVLVLASTLPLPRRIIYNPTPSAPVGWYAIGRVGSLHVHEFVLAQLPDDVATLADERRYLPRDVPILKEIGALEGQTVCAVDGVVSIDGALAARARGHDGMGRDLAPWFGCRALAANELFLLSRANDASFDSRYFGPITRAAVIGKATPVWTW